MDPAIGMKDKKINWAALIFSPVIFIVRSPSVIYGRPSS